MRPEKESFKDCMIRLLGLPTPPEEDGEKPLRWLDDAAENAHTLLGVSLLKKALNGDVAAFREIRSLVEASHDDEGQMERLVKGLEE